MKVISILPSEGIKTCDRCYKVIAHIVTIEDGQNIMRVGIDCAQSLQKEGIEISGIEKAEKAIKNIQKVRRWFKTCREMIFVKEGTMAFVLQGFSRKRVSTKFLDMFCPEIAYPKNPTGSFYEK